MDNLDTVFAALADPTRRAILTMLLEDDMAVTDVAEPFDMSLAAVSKHLSILAGAGLIAQEKHGRVKWCKLDPDALKAASVWMQGFGQFEPVNLDAFERFLEDELGALQVGPFELDHSETTFAALSKSIADAARDAFSQLLARHPEQFYYFTLITTGEAFSPRLSAWSKEALERACTTNPKPDEARHLLKWSYADSPYCGFGEECFSAVDTLFDQRGELYELSDEDADTEYEFRLKAMEEAMRSLDHEGLFGQGQARAECIVLVEVMPPDHTNTDRAIRLNSGAALNVWLEEMGES